MLIGQYIGKRIKHIRKHAIPFHLCAIFAGTLFFIPVIYVNRYITAPELWMQFGLSIGIIGYVILSKERIPLPPKSFIFITSIWMIYHIWQSRENIEVIIDIISLTAGFLLFYAIWLRQIDKVLMFMVKSYPISLAMLFTIQVPPIVYNMGDKKAIAILCYITSNFGHSVTLLYSDGENIVYRDDQDGSSLKTCPAWYVQRWYEVSY